MVTDTLADMLTRIKNASMVAKTSVTVPHTKQCEAVARIMLDSRYLADVKVEGEGISKHLLLKLVYVDGKPALSHLRRISKPGIRTYAKADALRPVLSGLGLSVVSTSRGIMSGTAARKAHLGGEVLVELW